MPLDLAALLCSRVCHDLISPTGAIVNGLEVLEEKQSDEETKTFALDLIKKSAQDRLGPAAILPARLRRRRLGRRRRSISATPRTWRAAFIEDDKTKLTWNLPRVLLPKNRVKLLLNMLIIAGQTIPRGGTLTVDPVGEGEAMGFRVTAAGLNARIPQAVPGLLEGNLGERIGRRPRDPAVLYRPAGARLRAQGRARRPRATRSSWRPARRSTVLRLTEHAQCFDAAVLQLAITARLIRRGSAIC